MREHRIFPLVLGHIELDKSAMMYFSYCGTKIKIPIACFYIQGSDKHILVDAGAPAAISQTHCPTDPVTDKQSFEEALSKVDLTPDDIDIIIQTHLHHDHIGNAAKCRRAEVVVQEDELRFALAPHPLFANLYGIDLLKGLNFRPIKGDTNIDDGIKVLFTPGHTPGSQSVGIWTSKGQAIITGFCSIGETFEVPAETKEVLPHWLVFTPGIHTDPLAAYDNALKVKGCADVLIPNHALELDQEQAIP
jgi:glyoxylase-like metal-dependent hydrolase (beta-lactamase superfamily II)